MQAHLTPPGLFSRFLIFCVFFFWFFSFWPKSNHQRHQHSPSYLGQPALNLSSGGKKTKFQKLKKKSSAFFARAWHSPSLFTRWLPLLTSLLLAFFPLFPSYYFLSIPPWALCISHCDSVTVSQCHWDTPEEPMEKSVLHRLPCGSHTENPWSPCHRAIEALQGV